MPLVLGSYSEIQQSVLFQQFWFPFWLLAAAQIRSRLQVDPSLDCGGEDSPLVWCNPPTALSFFGGGYDERLNMDSEIYEWREIQGLAFIMRRAVK